MSELGISNSALRAKLKKVDNEVPPIQANDQGKILRVSQDNVWDIDIPMDFGVVTGTFHQYYSKISEGTYMCIVEVTRDAGPLTNTEWQSVKMMILRPQSNEDPLVEPEDATYINDYPRMKFKTKQGWYGPNTNLSPKYFKGLDVDKYNYWFVLGPYGQWNELKLETLN